MAELQIGERGAALLGEARTLGAALRIGAALLREAGVESPRLDMSLMLANATGGDRLALIARPESELQPAARAKAEAMLARRIEREPIAYILGEKEFFGLAFAVDARVLIPRPETEHLVEAAIDALLAGTGAAIAADIGTGSGAVAVACAHALPRSKWIAVDASAGALQVAAANAARHAVDPWIEFRRGDLLDPIQEELDLIAANLPYIPDGDRPALAREVAGYEPASALFAGADGLDCIRRLIDAAPAKLKPGGMLLMECGASQAPAIFELLRSSGAFAAIDAICDLAGIERVVRAARITA